MCGITGILSETEGELGIKNFLSKSLATIKHRGPDGEGVFIHDTVGLGHRRLAILDLETGSQPLCNEAETIWITFSDEIYNYIQLRQELTSFGYTFRTISDAEVNVYAYEQRGSSCFQKLRGMFAIALFDKKNRIVILARDYFGTKPLLYYSDKQYFIFYSEIPEITCFNGFDNSLDYASIDKYLTYGSIPAPHTQLISG
jgi:asparagine synthase (glutamine-hydrolysing)